MSDCFEESPIKKDGGGRTTVLPQDLGGEKRGGYYILEEKRGL